MIDQFSQTTFTYELKKTYVMFYSSYLFLDIKVKEPTEESLTKKVRQYMDPRFMSVKEAAEQLVRIIENTPDSGKTQRILSSYLFILYLH